MIPEPDVLESVLDTYPGRHAHSAAPLGLCEWAGQATQPFVDRDAALNVPAAQAVRADVPESPVYPASGKQPALEVDPVTPPVSELLGQRLHSEAPVSTLKVSTGQAVGVTLMVHLLPFKHSVLL